MTNYYVEQNGVIKLFDTDKQKIKDTLLFMPELQGLEIKETQRPITASNDYTHFVFADTQEYLAEALQKAKETKISEINSLKEAAFKAGFYFNNAHFDCDDRAQIRLSAQLAIAKPQDTIVWLAYDYNPINFTYEEFVNMCAVATSIVSNIEFETSTLLSAVESAESVEELELLSINYDAVVTQIQQNTESEETNE